MVTNEVTKGLPASVSLNPDGMLEAALVIAAAGHGATDALYAGRPYILHPIRVMTKVIEWSNGFGVRVASVAVMHDLLEDTHVEIGHLKNIGMPMDVILAVMTLTRKDGETYEEYIRQVKTSTMARKVKLADIDDHLNHTATLKDSLRKRYEDARTYLKGA